MGRRKIEIQPIVHERNRSVTFLKRKNGLFKKAYELGVLCSVDVAVIIFEERAGHHVKCYQYCSGDIHDIVARQIKHDGERDTKGPSDFSGGNGGKGGDDNGDGDDDEADDDDDVVPSRSGSNKRSRQESSRSGLKLPNDMSDDYHHRGSGIPNLQHPSALSLPSTSGGLPISTVRTASSGSSIGPHSSNSSTYNTSSNPIASSRSGGGGSGSHRTHRTSHPSRSPPETHTPVSAGYGYHGHGHAPPSSFRGGYGGGGSNGPGGSSGGPSGAGGSGAFPNFYPNQTPPGGYVGLPGEYPRGGGPPSGGGAGGGGRRGFGATFGEGGGGGGGGMYSHTGGGGGGLHPRTRSGDAGQEGSAVFDFLDGSSRGASNPNSAPGFGLEWPGSGSGGAASGGGPPPPPAASSANPNSSGGGDWFELLSSAPNPSVQARDTKLSWERGGGSGGLGGAGGGSNDRHSMPSSANGGGVSRSPSVSSSSFSVGGHAGQMGGRGSMDMSIGMNRGGGGSSNMDVAMGGMGMAGASRDGVGVVSKVERRD